MKPGRTLNLLWIAVGVWALLPWVFGVIARVHLPGMGIRFGC